MNQPLKKWKRSAWAAAILCLLVSGLVGGALPDVPKVLPGTTHEEPPADILNRQHFQIDSYFESLIAATPAQRDRLWSPDFSSVDNYVAGLEPQRARLRRMLGMAEISTRPLQAKSLSLLSGVVEVEELEVWIEPDLPARALLFKPQGGSARPAVIAIAPAHQTREAFAGVAQGGGWSPWLQKLLSHGIAVAVPAMVERTDDHDLAQLSRGVRMSRRRLLHRLAFPVGRTVTGLEVLQVLALRQVLQARPDIAADRIGLLGLEQGGMTALYAAALDRSFAAAAVLDYFQQRESCWKEPVDRMIYGQLREFGDAEVAALVAPRPLALLAGPSAEVDPGSAGLEAQRARRFYSGLRASDRLKAGSEADPLAAGASWLAEALSAPAAAALPTPDWSPSPARVEQTRNDQFRSLHRHLRRLIQESADVRQAFWRLDQTRPQERAERAAQMRSELGRLMGVLQDDSLPLNPRTSLLEVTEHYAAYHLLVDVLPGVEAWGHLLVPHAIQGRAPIVITQHGGGGTPEKLTGAGDKSDTAYHLYGARLAELGYVVFAPMVAVGNRVFPNPRDREEELRLGVEEAINLKVRKAAALGMMRTGIEQAKLRRIIDFLQTLPFADGERIGYYGLSYGGYAATWMAPQETRIQASIISGHFNDWMPKITSERIATSYLRHPDEDFANWNVLHRFTHTELIAATYPRAVLVEQGERDGVTPPGWFRRAWEEVASHARSWERTDTVLVDYFDGVHEIHGVGALDFLQRILLPEQGARRDYAGILRPFSRQPYVTWTLDTSSRSIIQGSFHVGTASPVFSGLAFRLSRSGSPGDLLVRFGTEPGRQDLGEVRVPAPLVSTEPQSWLDVWRTPVRLQPGRLYYFQISVEWGFERSGDYYTAYAPAPLGGQPFPPHFNLSLRTLE